MYVGSEHVLLPWSKSADVDLWHPVQSVKRDKIYILDASSRQHKATLIETARQAAAAIDCTCLSPKWEGDSIAGLRESAAGVLTLPTSPRMSADGRIILIKFVS